MILRNTAPEEIKHRIIEHAHDLYVSTNNANNCKKYLLEKLSSPGVKVMYFENNSSCITGICIVEYLNAHYGNLILHTICTEDEIFFSTAITEMNLIKGSVLELVQFRSGYNFRDGFIKAGLKEKERMRMTNMHIDDFSVTPKKNGVTFKEIKKSDSVICGEISYRAHKHRQHIECYDIYNSPQKRAAFANELRTHAHGKTIDSACLIMNLDNTPVGLIEILHTNYIGTNMGWIMDIALLPEFQGMGLGKHMIKYSLNRLLLSGYSSVGLCVTLSNKNAYLLYKNMGFSDTEYVVEIIA